MKNKFLIELKVPRYNIKLNLYIPNNRKMGTIKKYIYEYINEITNYKSDTSNLIMIDGNTGVEYDSDLYVKDTNIKNGSKIIIS